MRFKFLAAAAAFALVATTVIWSQAGAQTSGSIEVEQTDTKVTMVASGCETGTVSFTVLSPAGTSETVNGTSIGSGRFSHLIDIDDSTPTGTYSVKGECATDSETLVTYEQTSFSIGASAADPAATAAPTATADPAATAEPTAAPTQTGALSLTASTDSLEIGKNAVITMTGCPAAQPSDGEAYRATLETTDPLGITNVVTHDYAGNSIHEMVFETTGATQPGDHTVVGLCEKKAGDAWSEVHRYETMTIAVAGVAATTGDATPTATSAPTNATPGAQATPAATSAPVNATPAATSAPVNATPAPIGFTG